MHRLEVSFENRTIFISRKLNHLSPIYIELNSLGYEIFDTSLIKFEQIRFTHTPPTQWIFFSSQNAIHYFFAQQPELNATLKFGVMSQVSADYLMEYHKKADFIGQGVDVTQIAKDFAKVVKDETVLFPQAIDSYKAFKNICLSPMCVTIYLCTKLVY
jgi:uroporphyrinogen-III synthase